jgi:MFS family permease
MGWVVVAVLCLVQFVDVLGVTSATTAIPAIVAGLGADESAAGLIATMYAMFFGGLLVLGARLGDRFGHRRILLIGIAAFALVSVVGGTANGLVQLLAARALQGAAAAISVPAALRLLIHVTPEPRARTSALAAWSAFGAAAGASGFLVGGLLVEALGWRAVFWVNAPIGVVLFAAVLVLVPALPPLGRAVALDIAGAVLLVAAVMAAVLGGSLVEAAGTRALGLAGVLAGVVIGAGFLAWQRRARAPLVPGAAFRSATLRRGTLISFVNTAATSSSAVLATLFLQQRLGASPIAAGLTLMGLSLAVIAATLVVAPVARRLGPGRLAVLGLALIAAGNLTLALTGGAWVGIGVGVAIAGFGLGFASVAGTSIGTDVPEQLTGAASGIVNTGAQLGTALGTAALVLVATLGGSPLAWLVAAVGAAVTAVLAATRSRAAGG